MKSIVVKGDEELLEALADRWAKNGFEDHRSKSAFMNDAECLRLEKECAALTINSFWLVRDKYSEGDVDLYTLPEDWDIVANLSPDPEVEEGQYWIDICGRVNRIFEDGDRLLGRTITTDSERYNITEPAYFERHFKRTATDDEVQQALIEEAERRGLRKNKEIKSARTGTTYLWDNDAELHYLAETDELIARRAHGSFWGGSAIVLYQQGEFAEIIEDEWRMNDTPPYHIKNDEKVIGSISGDSIDKKEAEEIRDALNSLTE